MLAGEIETSTDTVVKDGVCHMCTNSCPIKVHVQDGRATHVEHLKQTTASTCPRWKAQLDFIYHPERLLYPQKRIGNRGEGNLARISWDEALDSAAERLKSIKDKYGPEAVVFYVGYPKDPRPYFHRLTHAFGSPNYCTESSNCFASMWLATVLTYGRDLGDLRHNIPVDPTTKCKLVWGSTIRNSFPETWIDHMEAKKNGLKFIVVDPRRTKIAGMADIHLQLRPGTDGALALGMIHVIIAENLHDVEFIEKWTVGFEELRDLVKEYPPERVERITGVPAARIREAAVMYATERPAQIKVSICSTTHSTNGFQGHRAIVFLPALTGNLDVRGGNRGLPVFMNLNNITLHDRVADMPPGVGSERFPLLTHMFREMHANMIADQIESGRPYPVKALFGAGLNLAYFPNYKRFVKNLNKLDFILQTEYFPTHATRYADILLPISSWFERTMFIVRPTGHIRLVDPVIEPVGETWPEWKIFSGLAERLGLGDEFWGGDFDKCVDYILEPSGITAEDLRRRPEGIKVDAKQREERHYEKGGFKTPSGKVEISSSVLESHGYDPLPVYHEPMESPLSRPELAESFPLVLTTGARAIGYIHSQFRNIRRLRKIMPEPLIEINPADATPRGIETGSRVKISSPRGEAFMKARVTDIVPPGVVQAPSSWQGDANVNMLVDDRELDPVSGFASFKAILCQVTKY